MPVVKVDEKGRIQLPKGLRHELGIKARQSLVVQKQGDLLTVGRVGKIGKADVKNDPLLRDIILHPLKGKVKITKEFLDKLEEEQWSS
ncbi:MAG: AbrB/MazE/SpoVT family DNA-binding domain-containing protein [Candidatus Aenigmarchaeota archaeon]|nr:AbrB/MazE/SpoVT family DNA-binding domain-containing protein [Candidatus Aenigmarchaeota archaeon]